MKIKFEEKYNTIAFYIVVVFTVCLVIRTFITEIPDIFAYIGKIFSVMSPITSGIIIAYLISPLTNLIERHLKPLFFKSTNSELIVENVSLTDVQKYQLRKRSKLLRATSVGIAIVITLLGFIAIVAMVLPELINSLSSLFDKLPYYMNNLYVELSKLLNEKSDLNDTIKSWLEEQFSNIQKQVLNMFSSLKPQFEGIVGTIKDGVSSVLGGVKNVGIGLIISIYLMYSKEEFIAQVRKFMYAIFPNSVCKSILTMGVKCNEIFSSFIVGKAVDSLIIGILSFITLTIMDMPYTVLISLIVGVTNMIPFFGPFIGAIPSAILVLLSEPKQTIPFVVFIIILQQIDGNIIGPKILGDKMGLSTFWIMFAILVFGGLFNFVGMLIGVPLFTVLYTLIATFVHNRLKNKKLPLDKRYYGNMSITQDDCTFPNKQDYSDEDIDESKIPKKSNEILEKVKDKTNINELDLSKFINKFKDKFSNKK